jgi:hypothetical protein
VHRTGPFARFTISRGAAFRILASLLIFGAALAIRVHGISHHFSLLADQMRDWEIALRPFSQLPLVGPPTHVGGYTIGPAFYWILWAIRVVCGPFAGNLPHAGGFGQAALGSAADVLLLLAVWKRTGSAPLALTAAVVLVTAPFDLGLAAVIWNPVVGATLAKAATALVIAGWPRSSLVRTGVVAALAWCAVHAYTGAVFVALGVFAALVLPPPGGGRRRALRQGLVVFGMVCLLQVPATVHALTTPSRQRSMGAVHDSIVRVLSGSDDTRMAASARMYVAAADRIEAGPWTLPGFGVLLLVCAGLLAFGYRREPDLLVVLLLPQALAVIGYGFWLADLEVYYYLSLMPAVVLTILMGAMALVPPRASRRVMTVCLLMALAAVIPRVRASRAANMPEYDALVKGTRQILSLHQPMRRVTADFGLPPTGDPSYLFRILGGRIDPQAGWSATIEPDGRVVYERTGRTR